MASFHKLGAGGQEWIEMMKQFGEGRVYIANQGAKLLQEPTNGARQRVRALACDAQVKVQGVRPK